MCHSRDLFYQRIWKWIFFRWSLGLTLRLDIARTPSCNVISNRYSGLHQACRLRYGFLFALSSNRLPPSPSASGSGLPKKPQLLIIIRLWIHYWDRKRARNDKKCYVVANSRLATCWKGRGSTCTSLKTQSLRPPRIRDHTRSLFQLNNDAEAPRYTAVAGRNLG
jgi:hypothetical protein